MTCTIAQSKQFIDIYVKSKVKGRGASEKSKVKGGGALERHLCKVKSKRKRSIGETDH